MKLVLLQNLLVCKQSKKTLRTASAKNAHPLLSHEKIVLLQNPVLMRNLHNVLIIAAKGKSFIFITKWSRQASYLKMEEKGYGYELKVVLCLSVCQHRFPKYNNCLGLPQELLSYINLAQYISQNVKVHLNLWQPWVSLINLHCSS